MPIPDFQSVMLPLLRLMSDGDIYQNKETIEPLSKEFALNEAERNQLIPSGRMTTFQSRVAWARTYIFRAKLIERISRGQYRITSRGLKVVRDPPPRIDINYLLQFPEFQRFRATAAKDASVETPPDAVSGATPLELMDSSYREIRRQLAQELLDEIKSSPPAFFEQLVVDLLVAMGYGGSRSDARQAVGGSGDGGVDGIINEDRLGLDAIYLQAKRWENPVGRQLVQGFAGSLEGHRARKGVMITTSTFAPSAHEYVNMIEKRIVLIDGQRLAELMMDHGVGVSVEEVYAIQRIDFDYFTQE